MDMSKKPNKSRYFDLHFKGRVTPLIEKFYSEADRIGRTYTEHFKRLLEEIYDEK